MQTSKHTYLIQQQYENTFGKKGIHRKAVQDLKSSDCIDISDCELMITRWIESPHWESKQNRIDQISDLDISELIYDLLAIICLECQKPMKLVSVASICSKHLKMNYKVDSIQTAAEIIALMGACDLCDTYADKGSIRWVTAAFDLDEAVIRFKFNAMYLPPLLIKPRTLRHNRSSGYLTQQGESLILGYYENHHEEDICLDVLNILNANEYSLDEDVISNRTDEWTKKELTDTEFNKLSHEQKMIYEMDQSTWEEFNEQSYKIQTLMLYHNNSFYLQNKVDKRGRIYTSGYHISPQGNSFKKSMINLKKKEICTGFNKW